MPIIINQNTPTGKKVVILDNRGKSKLPINRSTASKPAHAKKTNTNKKQNKTNNNSKKSVKNKSSRPMREMIMPTRLDGLNIEDGYNYVWDYSDVVVSYIKDATSNAPVKVDVKLSCDTKNIVLWMMFIEEKTFYIEWPEVFNENTEFSVEKLKTNTLGRVYTECMVQMNSPKFDELTIAKETELFKKQVMSELNTEFEINDRIGYFEKDGIINIYANGITKELGTFEPEFNGVLKGTGVNRKIVYDDVLKKRIKKQINELHKRFDDTIIPLPSKAISKVDLYKEKEKELKEKYLGKIFWGSKENNAFKNGAKMYFKAGRPETIYAETPIGIFSTSTEWAFVEYREKFSDEWENVFASSVNIEKRKIWDELTSNLNFYLEYNGGSGIFVGKTHIMARLKDIPGNIIYRDLNFIEGDFRENLTNFINKATEELKVLAKEAEAKFAEKAKRSCKEPLSQLFFLYVWKNNGIKKDELLKSFVDEFNMSKNLFATVMGILCSQKSIDKKKNNGTYYSLNTNSTLMYKLIMEQLETDDIDEAIEKVKQFIPIEIEKFEENEKAKKEAEYNDK